MPGGPRSFVSILVLVWASLGLLSLLRFAAPEFRPWERLYDPENHRFLPERQVAMREIGDLGYRSWNRELQTPRPTVFTTDRFGYRNAEAPEHPRLVVIGDSFVAGSGLSDEETVTARLAEQLRAPVYNFASEHLNAPALFLREQRFANQRPEVVIWAPVARGIEPRPLFYTGSDADATTLLARLGEGTEAAEGWIARWVERLNRDNGLVREARFAVQGAVGRFRRDPYARRLPSGESVLALSLEEQGLTLPPESRGVEACIEMVALFARILEQAGVRFVFSPVPESGTLYPELFDAQEPGRAQPSFLDRLLEGVRRQGVEVVDLREVYRADPWPYLFQPDDTHWNPRATKLAAAAWAEALAADPALAMAREP